MKTTSCKIAARASALMGLLLANHAALAVQVSPTVGTIPEPDILALFGLGAVVALAVNRRQRGKKNDDKAE
jgi:hypothetical protein